MDPVDALTRLGGVARLQDLLRLTSRSRIRTAAASGLIWRIGQGRYALPTARPALELAAQLGGYTSHLCAAAELGWEIARQPELPQVVLPRKRVLPEQAEAVDVRRHHVTSADTRGLVTGPALTVLLCARDLPFDEALTVADSCLRHGDLEHDELVAAAASWPSHVQAVAERADGRAANPFESVLRALAIQAGLEVIPQYEVRARGLTLHPDLADPIRGIVLEADSWGFHASRSDHERDCVRYNALVVTGWQVLRFSYDHVMFSQAYVRTTIEHLVAELAA
ncbi:MAG: hypothetical protein ACRDO4_01335 [Nocardioides sp.]